MIEMMTTDTIDSQVAYRMISYSSKLGESASMIMGWIIVLLAYGVSICGNEQKDFKPVEGLS